MKLKDFLKKLLQTILVIFTATTVVFFLAKQIPSTPFGNLEKLTDDQLNRLNEAYGFNAPVIEQYFNWIKDALQGQFGYNIADNKPVQEFVLPKMVTSLRIGLIGVGLGMLMGIVLGLTAGINQNKIIDNIIVIFIIIVSSMPIIILAPVVQNFFKDIKIDGQQLFPISYNSDNPASFIAPIVTMSIPIMVMMARYTRAETVQYTNSTFVEFAKAKGMTSDVILFENILPNTLVSIITFIPGLVLYMLAGSFVIETVFSIPGLGDELIKATSNAEYYTITFLTMIYVSVQAFSYLFTDVLYSYVDPRIRVGGSDEQ